VSHRKTGVTTSVYCTVSKTSLFTISTVYVTVCDLEKSFSFDKTVEIATHLGYLGVMYTVHLWLVGRSVKDFLLVLI